MNDWWPTKEVYDPKISKEKWVELLKNDKVFDFNSMCMMKRFLDIGGEATCIELAKRYGRSATAYINFSKGLAGRVYKKISCPTPPEREGNARYWPILYVGRPVEKNDSHEGAYIWKLRDELKEALEEIGLRSNENYPLHEKNNDWDILIEAYKKLLKEHEDVAFFDEAYKWDTITCTSGKSWKEVFLYLLGKTDVERKPSNLFFGPALSNAKVFLDDARLNSVMDSLCRDEENLDARFKHFNSAINELTSSLDKNYSRPNDERSASAFLTCHNPERYTFYKDSYYSKLCAFLGISSESAGKKYSHYLSLIDEFERYVVADSVIMDFYSKNTAQYIRSNKLIAQNIIYVIFESGSDLVNLGDGGYDMSGIEKYKQLLLNTHNLILHGAPGTGKTHLAKEIAKAMGAECEMVQFHPSYDYTDFVEGLRPTNSNTFERVDGVFKEFCSLAIENKREYENSQKIESSKTCNIQELFSQYCAHIEKKIIESAEKLVPFSNTMKIRKVVRNKAGSPTSIEIATSLESAARQNLSADIFFRDYMDFINKKITSFQDVKPTYESKTAFHGNADYYFKLYQLVNEFENSNDFVSKNLSNNNQQPQTIKNFVFIIDEINRGELSKIFGELFFSIDPGYRGFDEDGKPKGLIQTQYQNLIEEDDVFFEGFYIPENVYIIGTMNDIDRSVESMDFAFRRRFTFKEIKATDTQDEILNSTKLSHEDKEEAKARMDALNEAIVTVRGLSPAYHIGAAYFTKLECFDDAEDKFESLWDYHLEGLLREYLRGMEDEKGLLAKLKSAYDGAGQQVAAETENS